MRTIYKYELIVQDDPQIISMHEGAKILHVGLQKHNTISMWAETETETSIITRKFVVVGTGYPITFFGYYVGTVIDQPFVWHLYEV